jgi:hypothetical protein
MILFAVVLVAHVIVAVTGIGLVGAVPIVARLARRGRVDLASLRPPLEVLLRVTRWGLAIMLLTGVLLDVTAGGAFHAAGWFRASGVLLVLLGFSHARLRSALRGAENARDDDTDGRIKRIERWGWTMVATVALLAALMALKPSL